MIMARPRAISSIEKEIAKTEAELAKKQQECEKLAAHLLDLQNQKQEYQMKQVMEAFEKSGKTFKELMTFLGE